MKTTAYIALCVLAILTITLAAVWLLRGTHKNNRDKLGLANAIAGTAVSFASLVVAIIALTAGGGPESSETVTSRDSDISGNGNCVNVTGGCLPSDLTKVPIDTAIKKLAALPGAGVGPTGNGPFPYVVLDTEDMGLRVRTGPRESDGRYEGDPIIQEGRVVYADCQVDDGWKADPRVQHNYTTWLKIRWPDVSSKADAWVYGGFTYAAGHNGDIPTCP